MNREELITDVKDLLVRIEGTINVLHRGDQIRANQKLQGMRDKIGHMLLKLTKEDAALNSKIQEAIGKNENDSD